MNAARLERDFTAASDAGKPSASERVGSVPLGVGGYFRAIGMRCGCSSKLGAHGTRTSRTPSL